MYLLFDIGGTKMRFAISKDGKRLDEQITADTPQDFSQAIVKVKEVALELSHGEQIKSAVGGVPGPLNPEKSILLNPPNLPGWSQKPLKRELQKVFGAKVYLENDAALAGLGEAMYGAGKGKDIVAYLTIGTGVGGARIVSGKIDGNALGFEPGHQVICFNGEVCGCGGVGHLEAYISGTAIEKRYHKKPYAIMDKEIWDELATFLAYGLNNVIVHWSPDVVALGGSMMKEVGIPIERVELYLKDIMKIFQELPQIKKATLGDKSGLLGAMAFLNQKLKAIS